VGIVSGKSGKLILEMMCVLEATKLEGWVMIQEHWGKMVEREASSTQWTFLSGLVALVLGGLTGVSATTGWGDPWLCGLGFMIAGVVWATERWTHKEMVRALEEMAAQAMGRSGIEV
jgi:protein-S-isoprenylcysteine O-methyltransferase Ste14